MDKCLENKRKEEVRLNKYISDTGFCSRREADKLIEENRVKVDGIKATMGSKVFRGQKVTIDNKELKVENKLIYIALNKPRGITCTTEKKIKGNIVDFINHEKRIFPIGRLDKDSEGLIFLTNDGDIVNKILRAGNNHEKEYIVTVNKNINDKFVRGMANGVPVLDTITKKCYVEKLGKNKFKIVLTQGLNRQIRRMCAYFGYNVIKLERVRIMNVKLDNLKTGSWRYLSEKELKEIIRLTSNSIKTEEGSKIKK